MLIERVDFAPEKNKMIVLFCGFILPNLTSNSFASWFKADTAVSSLGHLRPED